MQVTQRFITSAIASAVLAGAAFSAAAVTPPQYTIVDLGKPAGNNVSHTAGISPSGEYAVGRGVVGNNTAFYWTAAGGRVDLPAYNGIRNNWAVGVNDSGVVVGMASTGAGVDSLTNYYTTNPTPVVWKNGTATALASVSGRVLDINNAGLAVGSIGSAGSPAEQAVIYDTNAPGSYSVISKTTSDGIGMRQAQGINNQGQIYGIGRLADNTSVTLVYDPATDSMTRITSASGANPFETTDSNAGGVLAVNLGTGVASQPYTWSASGGLSAVPLPANMVDGYIGGINDQGWIAGYSRDGIGPNHNGFLSIDGESFLLSSLITNPTGWNFNLTNNILGIGNNGTIIGYAPFSDGSTHAYALVQLPVPEPSTYALLMAGLVVVGGMARRRRAAQS